MKRYRIGIHHRDGIGIPGEMKEHPEGEYVRYEDVRELERQLEAVGAGGVSLMGSKNSESSTKLIDIAQRLRCKYPAGPILPNGEPEFGWRDFGGPCNTVLPTPVMLEAAEHIETQAAEIDHLERELAVATDLAKQRLDALQMPMDKPSTWPLSAGQFETAAELIAMELAERDGHEGVEKHRLIWEGCPGEPWGEVWQRYIPDAQSMLSAGIAGIQDEERRGLTADAARAALSGEGK